MLRVGLILVTLITGIALSILLYTNVKHIRRIVSPSWAQVPSPSLHDESTTQTSATRLLPVAAANNVTNTPVATNSDPAHTSEIPPWPQVHVLPQSNQLSKMAHLDAKLREKHGHDGYICSDEFGIGMLSAWRSASVSMCSPRNDREMSTVTCFVRHKFDVPRYACALENVLIHDVEPYVLFEENDKEVPRFNNGFVTAQCMSDMRDKWMVEKMMNEPVGTAYVRTLHAQENALNCTQWINHTVLWIHRWDLTNAYHAMEEILTIYEVLLLFGLDSTEVELAFQDNRPSLDIMLFLPLLQRLFRNARVVRDDPFPDGSCFRHARFGVHAGMSHLSHNFGVSRQSTCTIFSPILRTAVDWIRSGLQIKARDESASGETFRRVVFVQRKAPFKRVIPNEVEVLADIRRALPDGWRFDVIAWEDLEGGLIQQIKTVTEISILVGVHGAGLTHTLFMPKRSALIELFYGDRGRNNLHYANIAQWLGDTHYGAVDIGAGRTENVHSAKIIDAIISAIDNISGEQSLR